MCGGIQLSLKIKCFQPACEDFIVPKIKTHKAFPQFIVIGYTKMQKFMHDNIVLQSTSGANRSGISL